MSVCGWRVGNLCCNDCSEAREKRCSPKKDRHVQRGCLSVDVSLARMKRLLFVCLLCVVLSSLVSSEVKVMCVSFTTRKKNNGQQMKGCGSQNYLDRQPQILQCVVPGSMSSLAVSFQWDGDGC